VESAVYPDIAYALHYACKQKVESMLAPMADALRATMNQNVDKRLAQCQVAKWRSTIAIATMMRDNLLAKGCSEEQLLMFMEAVMQPALAQMEGAVPIAYVLMGDPSEPRRSPFRKGRPDLISRLTGIPEALLVNEFGETDRWPWQGLNELRCAVNRAYQSDLYTLQATARMEPKNAHLRILSEFKDIEPY